MRAQRHGWTSSVVLDEVDQVVVDRVVFGDPSCDPPALRPQERQAALRRLAGTLADGEIAQRLGVATRTVARHRASQGLPAYAPVPPSAG
jgi:hypothetical protein